MPPELTRGCYNHAPGDALNVVTVWLGVSSGMAGGTALMVCLGQVGSMVSRAPGLPCRIPGVAI